MSATDMDSLVVSVIKRPRANPSHEPSASKQCARQGSGPRSNPQKAQHDLDEELVPADEVPVADEVPAEAEVSGA